MGGQPFKVCTFWLLLIAPPSGWLGSRGSRPHSSIIMCTKFGEILSTRFWGTCFWYLWRVLWVRLKVLWLVYSHSPTEYAYKDLWWLNKWSMSYGQFPAKPKAFFIITVFHITQISKKIHHGGPVWSLRLFCRGHWAGHVCQISCQSESRCEGCGLSKIVFLNVNYSATIWPIGLLRTTYTSFPVIGPTFMFLAHSSSQEFEPRHKTTNNNKPTQEDNNNIIRQASVMLHHKIMTISLWLYSVWLYVTNKLNLNLLTPEQLHTTRLANMHMWRHIVAGLNTWSGFLNPVFSTTEYGHISAAINTP